MKKLIILFFVLLFTKTAWAQQVANFENFNLPPNTFLNNSGTAGAFTSGGVTLPNAFNPAFSSWSGWAISNTTDTKTPGFLNESSAITGSGAEGSSTYAVGYPFGELTMRLNNRGTVNGLYVTNTTYAYFSILEGDAFAKKFGGVTGNDPDFFLLTIKKYYNGTLSSDSINFYLADYRFSNNSQDYIVKDWTWLNLSTLGIADSLQFKLSSSDVGAFGMNTPAYFAVDNVTTTNLVSVKNAAAANLPVEIFPNPAVDVLTVYLPQEYGAAWVEIMDAYGKEVMPKTTFSVSQKLDVSGLPSGSYFIRVWKNNSVGVRKFVK